MLTINNQPENVGNKQFKIQPVLDHVRQNCLLVEPEVVHSIDEQIKPAKQSIVGFVNIILRSLQNGVYKF